MHVRSDERVVRPRGRDLRRRAPRARRRLERGDGRAVFVPGHRPAVRARLAGADAVGAGAGTAPHCRVTEIHPFLSVRDVDAAVDLYRRAFGATLVGEITRAPNGASVGEMQIDGCGFGIASEAPAAGTPSPETAGATTV